MRSNQRVFGGLAGVVALSLAVGHPVAEAQAQDQTAQAGVLEEVVVTARKREESLQDMALSVSAFDANDIEQRFARDMRDIVDISPNLIVDDTSQGPGGVAAVSLRGIGVSEVESSFDPAVGVVIDGIFLGKASGSIAKMIDIERIEVLRGPQGTLFGRNSIGGVINITRTKPSQELYGRVRGSYANYDHYELDAMINLPVTDQFAVKLLASRHDQREGYYRNILTGRRDGEVEYTMYGAHMLFQPLPNVDLEYSYTREEYDQDTPPLLNVGQPGQLFCDVYGYCGSEVGEPISGGRYRTWQDGPNEATFDADTHMASLSWDIDDRFTVDYIFGYRKTKEEVAQDWDGTPEVLYHTDRPEKFDQTSHELRLTQTGDRLDFTVGAYLFEMEYTIDLLSYIGFAVPGMVIEVPQTSNQQTDSWAGFFEADYRLTDDWVLTLGGRYSKDKKKAQITNDPFISHPEPVSESWSEFTPKVGLSYYASDDVMLYALYSTGYRAGGFSGRPTTQEAADLPYDPETVDNIELGMKSQWFDNRLRFNISGFRMKYDDKQEEQSVAVQAGTGQQTVVANAASATIWGVEMDFVYLPEIEGLTLSGNLGWLDASYDDFLADIGFGGVTDNSGLDFRRAPEWTASLSAVYEWEVQGGTAWTRVGWHYIGSHEVSLLNSPQTSNSAQHLVDASLNYRYGNATVSLFGRNLLKEDGYTVGFDVGGLAGGALWTYTAVRPPRTYGIQVSYDF